MDKLTLVRRQKRLMPHWFGSGNTPVLDTILYGISSTLLWSYNFILFAKQQTRLGTATGMFLDIAGFDFFGRRVKRRSGETDDFWRARIKAEIFRPRVTRPAIIKALTDLTGKTPIIFEPANTGDTGGWDTGAFAYAGNNPATGGGGAFDKAAGYDNNSWEFDSPQTYSAIVSSGSGAWGDTILPYQLFITVFRPGLQGIASVSGFDSFGAGYDAGPIEYVDSSMIAGQVTDQDIYDTINYTRAAGVIAWTQLQ